MSYLANNIHQNFVLILDLEKPTCKKSSVIYQIAVRQYLHMRSKQFIHSVAEIPVLADQQFDWKVNEISHF